ncbi:Histone H2B, partial [Caligus rogercresseyi]
NKIIKSNEKRKSHKRNVIYICKILKQVHHDTGHGHYEPLCPRYIITNHCGVFSTCTQSNPPLLNKENQTAVRLLLPGELAKHGVSERIMAVTKQTTCLSSSKEDDGLTNSVPCITNN